MNIRSLAKDFVTQYLGKRENYFETVWDLAARGYDDLADLSKGADAAASFLGMTGMEDDGALVAILVFVHADKSVGEGARTGELIRAVEAAGNRFKAPEGLIKKIANLLRESSEDASSEQEADAYAMIWTHETKDPEGKPLTKEEVEERRSGRAEYEIFIVDEGEYLRNRVGEVYLNQREAWRRKRHNPGEKYRLTPLEYRILVHVIKNRDRKTCRAVPDLVEHCWLAPIEARGLRDLKKTRNADYWAKTKKHRTGVAKLSKFLDSMLGVQLTTKGTGQYDFTERFRYSLIEVRLSS